MNDNHGAGFDGFGDIIDAHTRQQMLDDGDLVAADVKQAEEAGFLYPLAYTRSVFVDCVEWTEQDTANQSVYQDQSGREWDVLWMAANAMRRAKASGLQGDRVTFAVYRVRRDGDDHEPQMVLLLIVAGPDDEGSPCLTVMNPGEED